MDITYHKFIIPVQGGFDGCDPCQPVNVGANISSTNMMGFNLNTAASTGTITYNKALDTIANPYEIDTNMIVMPGVIANMHKFVVAHAL